MANQHQDPNRSRPAEDRARRQQPAAGKRSGHAGPTDPARTPGTKSDPPSRQPGEYPETTPDVIAGNRRANAKDPKSSGGPGSEDKRRPGDSSGSRNQDSRRPNGPDRWSGDESRPESSDDEPIDR